MAGGATLVPVCYQFITVLNIKETLFVDEIYNKMFRISQYFSKLHSIFQSLNFFTPTRRHSRPCVNRKPVNSFLFIGRTDTNTKY